MRDLRFEYDRGDASLHESGGASLFSAHGPLSLWSIVGAAAFGLAIAILWGIVPADNAARLLLAEAAGGPHASLPSLRATTTGFMVDRSSAGPGEARQIVLTPDGDIILASPDAEVLLVRADRDGDGRVDGVTTLMGGLDSVRGLALDGGWLYVAEADRMFRVRFDAARGRVSGPQEKLADLSIDGSR